MPQPPAAPNRRRSATRTTARQRRAAMPPRLRLLADITMALVGAGAALFLSLGPGGLSWPISLAIAATSAAAVITWRVAPRFVYTAAVIAVWLLLTPTVTWLFAAVTPEMGLNYEGRLAGLAMYGLLVAILAHRYTRGIPAVTVAAALAAVIVIAALTYAIDLPGGVWLAYLAGFLVVAFRGKPGDWVLDTIDQAIDWYSTRKDSSVAVARWDRLDSPEAVTAAALLGLPDTCTAIHDRTIPGSVDDAATIDHIVTGPAGVTVIGSIRVEGAAITANPDGTLRSGRVNLDRSLRECSWQAQVVSARSDTPAQAVLVVHGAAVTPTTVGMWDHQGSDDETLVCTVILLPGDDPQVLVNTCTTPADENTPTWSTAKTRRIARRIAHDFPAGQLHRPSSLQDRDQASRLWPHTAQTRVLDPDIPSDQRPEHREYDWDGGPEADELAHQQLVVIADSTSRYPVGSRVNAMRETGMLIGWIVISEPYLHADGPVAVVDIADPDDWAQTQRRGTAPTYFLAEPLEHLMPVETS